MPGFYALRGGAPQAVAQPAALAVESVERQEQRLEVGVLEVGR